MSQAYDRVREGRGREEGACFLLGCSARVYGKGLRYTSYRICVTSVVFVVGFRFDSTYIHRVRCCHVICLLRASVSCVGVDLII